MPERASQGRADRGLWPYALLLLTVLWVAGIATRSVWTPDEPREYALSFNMLAQADKSVPLLAERPFAEKPPLTYWAAAGAMHVFGTTPVAARLPNLLYGLLTVLCAAALAASMVPAADRSAAGVVAAIVCGTAWLNFLHTIWLATDAPLLAASAVALLGAWLGPTAVTTRLRTAGYALFGLGLAAAFLAKNLLGLIAPLLAFGLFIVWDRRWRELLRWQLWTGLLLTVAIIGAWILAVSRHGDGARLLRVFLWDNSVGRFLPVESSGDYRNGHVNSPGKLVSEVALGLMPWLFAALAAGGLMLRGAFRRDALTSAARFLVVAALPLIALLSFSSTVRDVYALPSMVPLTAAVGVWWTHRGGVNGVSRAVLLLTRVTLLLVGILGGLLALAVPWVASGNIVGSLTQATLLFCALLAVLVAATQLARSHAMLRGLGVFIAGLTAFLLLASPAIEQAQDLRPIARAAAAAAGTRPLLLTARDETMTAALDYSTRRHGLLGGDLTTVAHAEPGSLALIEVNTERLTPAMRTRLHATLPWFASLPASKPEPVAQALFAAGWTTYLDLPNPGGRHYQLLTPPGADGGR